MLTSWRSLDWTTIQFTIYCEPGNVQEQKSEFGNSIWPLTTTQVPMERDMQTGQDDKHERSLGVAGAGTEPGLGIRWNGPQATYVHDDPSIDEVGMTQEVKQVGHS